MLRKGMSLMTILSWCLAMPLVANAASWTLNTWVKSAGGNIVSRNMATPQTSINGSLFRTYTTQRLLPVQVSANAGYTISNVTVNGVVQALPVVSGTTYTVAGPTAQSVYVTFVAQQFTATATAGSGGTVSPSGTVSLFNGSTYSATFSPSAGNSVIAISGLPASGYTLTDAATNAAVTLPAPPNVKVKVTIASVSSSLNLAGTFVAVIANAGPSQTVIANFPVTLDGTGSTANSGTITSYTWAQISGNPVTLNKANPAQPTFTPTFGGTYQFQLVVGNGMATSAPSTTIVNVSSDVSGIARSQCQNCHQGNGVGAASNVFANWSASKHNNTLNPVLCYNCHVGANTGGHPGPALTTLANVCANCHTDSAGNVPLHPVPIGANTCVTCHDPHSALGTRFKTSPAHYNNITGSMYPASYMTSRANCSDCHNSAANNLAIRQQWAASGHANTADLPWIVNDFKTMNACVQCHTTTGFIAYSSAKITKAWGVATDKTKEVLTCIACHSDIGTGTLRRMVTIKPYASDTYVNPNVGKSNICMACHSGKMNGKYITTQLAAGADFTKWTINTPHYLAAGGTLNGVIGYRFPGSAFNGYSSNLHQQIGMGNLDMTTNSGPCVSCHKSSASGHTMQASTANPLCANCHSTGFSDTQLAASRASYINALGVLQAQLAAKGYVYSPNPPYFANTNWGAGQTGANNMGAAFNYLLLLFEPGAFAHNPAYAKKLIFDSIDFLYNGTLTGSIDSALNSLVASGAITPAAAQSMTSYNSTSSSCISCHGGTASTPAPMATNAHPAHLTSSYGPGGYLGSALASCQTCHSFTSTTHRNGAVDLINGAGSSCAGCHPGGLPAWTSTSRIACTVCHAATPSKLPNGVAAPNKPYFAAAGHGRFGASNACTSCHDPNSPHISGSLGVNMRLFTTDDNTQCASCHNQTTAPRMSTHVLDKNATPTPSLCNSCHDPHGTTNAFMIRSTINGVAISFTNASTSFVQTTAPYKGLCQVCHTLTTHFRAGQLPDGHPTRNCLSCHSHTAAAFAFAPAGNCDSCHGYPPAPAGFVGTTGNYIGARAQDYLGGAGAHMIAAHVKPTALPSEGWANCTGCHGNGAINPVTHTMIMPVNPSKVTINMDDRFKYNATLPLGPQQYTGVLADGGANATGSCFNVKCHFKSSKKWSTQK